MIRPEHLRELDRLTNLAFDEAIRLEHSFCSAEHFLLAYSARRGTARPRGRC
jgi:hypothetical protein